AVCADHKRGRAAIGLRELMRLCGGDVSSRLLITRWQRASGRRGTTHPTVRLRPRPEGSSGPVEASGVLLAARERRSKRIAVHPTAECAEDSRASRLWVLV